MKSGFILINKEKGISSSKIDYFLKKNYDLDKCGHLGTLDPLAVGLLVVGINKGTKLFKYFDNLDKTYILTVRLGATTESLDYEKEINNKIDTNLINQEEMIDNVLITFKKKYNQLPPIYSAIKYAGKKLYEYALNNQEINLKEREVEIYDIKRINNITYEEGSSYFDIMLHVSKGFYVRSFANELASKLNTIGMAHMIKRIQVGSFLLEDSISKEEFNFSKVIDPLDYLNFKRVELSNELYNKVINGVRLSLNECDDYILFEYNAEPIAIYKKNSNYYEMDELLK